MKRAFLLTVLIGFAPIQAMAQNFLFNPFFDTDLADWGVTSEGFGMSHHWDPLDADSDPFSGSARIEFDPTTSSVFLVAMFQNNDINDFTEFTFGADVFIPSGQSTSHRIQLIALTYEQPGCFGNHQGTVYTTSLISTQDQWVPLMGDFTAPAGAHCARVSIRVGGTQDNVLTAHVDNAYLFEVVDLGAIFSDSLEAQVPTR